MQKKIMRPLLRFLFVTVFVFGMVNLVWYLRVKKVYDQYTKDMEREIDNGELVHYAKDSDDYQYRLIMPRYLQFSSFMYIGKKYEVYIDDNGTVMGDSGDNITLYIWTHPFRNEEYGIFFYSAANDLFEQIMVDSDGQYICRNASDSDEKAKQMIEENQDEIQRLLLSAREMWGFD